MPSLVLGLAHVAASAAIAHLLGGLQGGQVLCHLAGLGTRLLLDAVVLRAHLVRQVQLSLLRLRC